MYKISPFQFSYATDGKNKKIFCTSSLVINQGDAVLITGPSGGGKSTFLKIMKGIIPQFSAGHLQGEVLFKGKKLYGENFEHNLSSILYLFQNPFSQLIYSDADEEFFFSMENMNFTPAQMEEKKRYFEDHFNLKSVWGKKNSTLSNGECQRLVFSSLLAIGPEVLLLDEPTAFIDPIARQDFYGLLKRAQNDRLLMIVDHHVDEVLPLVNRVIEVSAEGEVREISREKLSDKNKQQPPALTFNWEQLRPQPHSISVSNLSFGYAGEPLLNNISATFLPGEVIAIKGDNGAGKSTFFKLLAGILRPQGGSVTMVGANGKKEMTKISSDVGFIFQNPETHFFFDTVAEELNFSLKLVKSQAQRQEIIDAFFHDLDLSKSPFLLSEGEKRRLSILMSVFSRKALYLYDEPTFGQDEKSKQLIVSLMEAIKKQDAVQIVISHDDAFIRDVADKVYCLSGGGLVEG